MILGIDKHLSYSRTLSESLLTHLLLTTITSIYSKELKTILILKNKKSYLIYQ